MVCLKSEGFDDLVSSCGSYKECLHGYWTGLAGIS